MRSLLTVRATLLSMGAPTAEAIPDADHGEERSDGGILARRGEVRAYLGASDAGVNLAGGEAGRAGGGWVTGELDGAQRKACEPVRSNAAVCGPAEQR